MIRGNGRFAAWAALVLVSLLIACPVRAQQDPASDPPAASSGTTSPEASGGDPVLPDPPQPQPPRDDRIFKVMPNYLTVEGAQTMPPLRTREKYKLALLGTFDPYEFAIVGFVAGLNQATDKDNSYGQGGLGYAKRYGAGFADQAIGNVMTGALFPTLLHEDPRYYQLGHGGFRHRAAYALSRIVVTRTDSNARQFNYSEFFGNAAAAGIAMTYRDEADRNLPNVAYTWAEQVGVDAIGNELKEFWPDIHRKVFHGRKPQQEE